MKTDDFITALATDLRPQRGLGSVFAIWVAVGVAIAAALFFAAIGFRADILSAVESVRFLFKFVVTIALAVTATACVIALGRPGNPLPWKGLVLGLAPLLLAGAVAVELARLPEEQWLPSLVGHNARFCLTLIPLLAIGPLACILVALRQGAPTNPGMAGAVAGLAASGIAASFYAANCTDDSPLFVITWYPMSVLIVTVVGFVCGRTLLRW